jgi:protein-L-isoaspartate(D-aspartate) O-methyltransferase
MLGSMPEPRPPSGPESPSRPGAPVGAGTRRRGLVGRLVRALLAGGSVGWAWRRAAAGPADDEVLARRRQRMVDEIAVMARDTGRETGRPRYADAVMAAMARVPRHRFVPDAEVEAAYRNHPLPIGSGQTISQPFIVALSTDLVDPRPDHVVLEIGTGSGYQAAVLAELVARVYTIEIVEPLGREAAHRLAALGYRNVQARIGDGYRGWPEHAPFDAIVVTAAAPFVPEPLLAQLRPGGRMVIPVGAPGRGQDLLLITKGADGTVARRPVLAVRFVPLTGEGAR